MNVSAVLVTRGNVSLDPIKEEIARAGIADIVVWDNAVREDKKVAGRYEGIAEANHDIVVVQDDDCIIDVARVVAAYAPGRLVANMPVGRWSDYPDSALVGWGAVFDRDLPDKAFRTYFASELERDPKRWAWAKENKHLRGAAWQEFDRTCDVIFSALTPRTIIDVGFRHREFAEGSDRMFKQPGHKAERDAVLERCRAIRGKDDDVRIPS